MFKQLSQAPLLIHGHRSTSFLWRFCFHGTYFFLQGFKVTPDAADHAAALAAQDKGIPCIVADFLLRAGSRQNR